jgi:hypothetical protein
MLVDAMKNPNRFARTLTLSWLLITAAIVAASLLLTSGHLTYSLDDPYIHLAVAENILGGGYGVNGSEYSSPSSSVAYPLVLALTELLRLGDWAPLVINLLAMGTAVFALGLLLARHVLNDSNTSLPFALLAGIAIALCMNAWGLPMTGMEHSLHVLTVVLVMLGFAGLHQNAHAPWWLVAAIVFMPLLRFEGFALALASVCALFALGHRRAAFVSIAAISVAIGTWMAVMHFLSLPLLPSSVMVKSGVAANAVDGTGIFNTLKSIAENLMTSLTDRQATFLVLALGPLVAGTIAAFRRGERHLAIGVGANCTVAVLAHLVFGRYGWFARYEIYIVSAAVLALFVLWRQALVLPAARFVSLWLLAVLAVPYAYATLQTPFASRGIYEQQYQMHRFATEFWKRPVAVNDLGYVSYRNPDFVLDLWGLGSEEVRQLKRDRRLTRESISTLLTKYDVSLVMIYESWFRGSVPEHWERVAVMKSAPVTAASGDVSFFAVGDIGAARQALQAFAVTLPPRVQLQLLPTP